jgi:chromate transporter
VVVVLRDWARLGIIGFGGPPAHIRLLRDLCVQRNGWIDAEEFEDAIATTNLLPGPASTQLAILCAWRVGGLAGGIVGGLAFIVPGLLAVVALAKVFLAEAPPRWVLGAGAGAGAAVAAVAVHAGVGLIGPSVRRARSSEGGSDVRRWTAYLVAGLVATATVGPWLVLVLLACGLVELGLRTRHESPPALGLLPAPVLIAAGSGAATLGALGWLAIKVGALSYGGGFVIVPLMQADAVGQGWLTDGQFLNAVALGQVTPGPVVCTIAAVGYAAAGLGGAFLAAGMAFAPSFVLVLGAASRFDRIRRDRRARAFLDGAGPAAIGAIFGSAIPLAAGLAAGWQYAVLAAAALLLFMARRSVVGTLVAAGVVGALAAIAGAPL